MDRKIDYLGRITIPKEIKKQVGIADNEIVSLDVVDNKIVLSKKEPVSKDQRRTTIFLFDKNRESRILLRKEKYTPGTYVKCLNMESEPNPIPLNMVGKVIQVDDIGTIHVKWKNGRDLGVLDVPGDTVEIISEKDYNNYKGENL